VRVIEHVTNLVTREAVLSAAEARTVDLTPVLAVERTRGEAAFWGFLRGFGLREGAYATTKTWDSPDLLVVGRDWTSVATAIRRIAENGGGGVFARGGEVLAENAAPICAVASSASLQQVRAGLRSLEQALERSGVAWESPLLTVDTLGTPAIPHLRVTHHGYVRLKDRAVLPREA
jgi:adenine deaminase